MRRCTQCHVDYPDALDVCPADGARLPPAPATPPLHDPLLGSTIDGRYVVESILGEGGMGVVYAGRHAIIDKRVAIKVLRKEYAADDAAAQRFLAEAKAASKIGHVNIVDITDFGVLPGGHAYFVMEFIRGPTLGQLMREGGPMAPARAAHIAAQVCRGLHAAHAKGIVHRDLKPDNIFVLERADLGDADFVKIVDFGIARDATSDKRLTMAGTVLGTPEYMAPEQASGQEADHRVDQYALGCILYEALTGQVPFLGENAMQTLTKHVFAPVTPPSQVRADVRVPRELELVILKTLAKKRDDRYADMERLSEALEAIAPGLKDAATRMPRVATPLSPPPRDTTDALTPARRDRRPIFIGAAVAVVALGGLGFVALRPPAQPVAVPKVEVPKPAPLPAMPAPAPKPVATPDPPVAASVEISLSSVPPGAEVYCGDELVGNTPTKTRQPRAPEGELVFVFKKPGYRPTTRKVLADKDAYVDVLLLHEAAPQAHTPLKHPVAKQEAPPAQKPPPPKPQPKRNGDLRNPFDDPPR